MYLLYSNNDGFIFTGAAILTGIVIWFFLLRTAVRSDSISAQLAELINQQKATNWFLIKMCEKQGVSQEEIQKIKSSFNIK